MGSSPHTRGALCRQGLTDFAFGIIPAYAGSTSTAQPTVPASKDHPRIRGEHGDGELAALREIGSSPHTRGARRIRMSGVGRCRIIPAYAGSTGRGGRRAGTSRDHPRIRGEHRGRELMPWQAYGSSPHTRGARRRGAAPCGRRRIIPAYAGSTYVLGRPHYSPPDHPRIRGEHHRLGCAGDFGRGSSPHTRGAPRSPFVVARAARIIPAYAGSTWFSGQHKRGCTGSSPHTRGARERRTLWYANPRIIPAYAGSTRALNPGGVFSADHPRIRGEHAAHGPEIRGRRGSSPHTRGARG